MLPVDQDIAECAAGVRRKQRIKTPDAIIAGSCLLMNMTLITENYSDFDKIEGLKILKF